MSKFFNFVVTIFLLLLGHVLMIVPSLFFLDYYTVRYSLVIPIVSFIFGFGYLFSHYNDWKNESKWKICVKYLIVIALVFPWFLHFKPNGVSINVTDTFSVRPKQSDGQESQEGMAMFCSTYQIIRNKDQKVIKEIGICEENIETVQFDYPTLTVTSDLGRILYKKNFLFRWVY